MSSELLHIYKVKVFCYKKVKNQLNKFKSFNEVKVKVQVSQTNLFLNCLCSQNVYNFNQQKISSQQKMCKQAVKVQVVQRSKSQPMKFKSVGEVQVSQKDSFFYELKLHLAEILS